MKKRLGAASRTWSRPRGEERSSDGRLTLIGCMLASCLCSACRFFSSSLVGHNVCSHRAGLVQTHMLIPYTPTDLDFNWL